MKIRHTKKLVVITATTAVALGAAGSAYALWTSTATGPSSAKALTAVNVTVNASTGTADLFPGSTGKVSFTLTNTNPYPITFTSMAPGAVTSSNEAACPASNVSVATASGLTLPVAANTTSSVETIPSVVTLASSAGDGCQGVVFTVALTLTGSQA